MSSPDSRPAPAAQDSRQTAAAERLSRLQAWLAALPAPTLDTASLRLVSEAGGDAGPARQFHVEGSDGQAYLAFDLPGAAARFVQAAGALGATGVSVPAILAHDAAHDFVLTSHPGPVRYVHQLNADTATKLNLDAIDALVLMQVRGAPDALPEADRASFLHELKLFPEWFVGKHLGVQLSEAQAAALDKVFDTLLATLVAQPQVVSHGDYSPRQLVVLAAGNPGMLGFQDARFGPMAADLVALLRDATLQWDEELVLDWAIRYWERARRAGLPVAPDIDTFYLEFEYASVQRHLAQLGRAARHYHRDGSDALLEDIPALVAYVRKTAFRYRDLAPLVRLFDEVEDKQTSVGYTF